MRCRRLLQATSCRRPRWPGRAAQYSPSRRAGRAGASGERRLRPASRTIC